MGNAKKVSLLHGQLLDGVITMTLQNLKMLKFSLVYSELFLKRVLLLWHLSKSL